jgi:AAA domain/TrwC relaxase
MFTHRTSRDGDPQLHVHSLVPNLVQRADGTFVAVDANPVHEWLKASGTIFQSELQRHLTDRLGVAWGPERNGCRELIGFTPEQRRVFSKRTAAIETVLEAGDEAVTAKERMRADDRASLMTRKKKDRTLTPNRLRSRWEDEAASAVIPTEVRLRRTVCHQATPAERPDPADVFAALVDPEAGLCANRARFGHAHVVERVAALSGGRLTVTEIEDLAVEFLRTELVVRLVPPTTPGQRKPPEWSTLEHRQLEDHVLQALAVLQHRSDPGLHPDHVDAAVASGSGRLGDDQQGAVRLLCGPGAGVRVVLAPAGHGKTALTATAAATMTALGRPVVALATTNKAVAELRSAGLDASTISRFRLDGAPLTAGSVVIIDEVSQVSTRDADAVLAAVSETPGAVVWCLGDDDQGRSVQPGGLATELRRLADQVAAARLNVNRRQRNPAERDALTAYRSGDIAGSQAIRDAQRWEHDQRTPVATRDALAAAAVADADMLGAGQVTVLAVSHADCEDLADRIRAVRIARGELTGPVLEGPGWGPTARRYAAGDRILFHTSLMVEGRRFTNGTTGTIAAITPDGAVTAIDDGTALVIPAGFVRGERVDGTPNMSHGWARTIDGAQGGTWEQVHLLATPNLDRLSAYVGQSRGRRPTHTWNTTPEPGGEEHGNVVLDPRDPAERVLAAVARIPERRFAAADDPFVLDRQLRAERAEHESALAGAPPDRSTLHARLTGIIDRREQEARRLWDGLGRLDRQIAKTGGLRQLRPDTRRAHRDLLAARDATYEQLRTVQEKLRDDRTMTNRLGWKVDEHARWVQANQWRQVELDRIDRQLADHWTDTVLTAVHQDDPLAYGLDRLRQARAVLASRQGTHAERDLHAVDHALGQARVTRIQAVAAGAPPPAHLSVRLGPLPEPGYARDTWCGLALHIERRVDRGIAIPASREHSISIAERLAHHHSPDPLDNARAVIAAAYAVPDAPHAGTPDGPARWLQAVDVATHTDRAIEQHRSRELDRDLRLSL